MDKLRGACEIVWDEENPGPAAVLLIICECFLSKRQLQSCSRFARFAYDAARHQYAGVRVNAMRLLRRFATFGDQKAIRLLKESAKDPNKRVCKTAQASLKLAVKRNR